MKTAKITYLLVMFLVTLSCVKTLPEEDTRYFKTENDWIYDVMKSNYLFRDKMSKSADFSQEPTNFFHSLLDKSQDMNKKGTHPYSRIEVKGSGTKSLVTENKAGYGFEFISYISEIGIIPRVLYVLENSPAQKAGLQRGDYIYQINNQTVTTNNLQSLYSGNKKTLLVSETTSSRIREIILEESVPINNKPLYMYKVIENGRYKVAYVVYNHFTSGVGDDVTKDRRYNDELCTMSKELAAAGVNEMVLDLRYNGGGQIDCAQLLSTIIAPATAMGKIFCTIVDVNGKEEIYRFNKESLLRNGANLNLQRLFILTSESTASASELMINCLRPYMKEIIIIGDVTEGKNVGSRDYKHENFNHILKPLMCYVYNREGKADYQEGFKPNYEFKDFTNYEKQYALGDTREAMLEMALSIINNTPIKRRGTTKAPSTKTYNYKFNPITTGIELD